MKDNPKFQGLRRQLIALLESKGIDDPKVLKAIGKVPRHLFMDPSLLNLSYEDNAYPIAADQTISQPYTVAFQTQLLQLESQHKILEIGTGSGYQTAVLMEMSSQVYSIERQHILFKKTQRLFRELRLRPRKLIFGDGYQGLPEAAPFERILVTAGAPEVPKALLSQLAVGGILVIPVGVKVQTMTRFTKTSERSFDKEQFGNFRFVPLLENKN
ncbi:MAG: protein-L-isoaspartate(D-aspartate) O-methyltransferase [Flavobacteriaceae bacterium]